MFFWCWFDVFKYDVVDNLDLLVAGGIGRSFDPEDIDLFLQSCEAGEVLAGFVEEVGVVGAGIANDEIVLVGGIGFQGEVIRPINCQSFMAFPIVRHIPVAGGIQRIDE